jgi:rod shape-determining protein MreC
VKRNESSEKLFVIVVALCVCAVVHHLLTSSSGTAERISSYLMYPILLSQQHIVAPIKSMFAQKKTVQELELQVKRLEIERDHLLATNIELQSSISYAQQTKELSDYRRLYNTDAAFIAQILVKNFSDQSHYFFVDGGSLKGVQPDMVAVYKNCLVGRVTQVYPHYSKVMLITDKTCKVAAQCTGTKALGIHEGCTQENQCVLNYVSHLFSLERGDLVISSGEGLVFPKGFALGKVKEFTIKGVYYTVDVEPMIDLRRLNYCYIIQKGELSIPEAEEPEVVAHKSDKKVVAT